MTLSGKVALVTGASRGLGAAIARRLAAEGAAVVVNCRVNDTAAVRVAEEITAAGGSAFAAVVDLTKPHGVWDLFDTVAKAHGRLDILVNNAGLMESASLDEIDADDHYGRLFDLNVWAVIRCTQEASRLMTQGGSIVNISSIVSSRPNPGGAIYAATKAAVDSLTRTFAVELADRGIRVNAVNPGLCNTASRRDEVTSAVLEFCVDEYRHITGHCFEVGEWWR